MKFYGINSRGKFWVHRVADIESTVHEGAVDEGRILYNLADQRLYAGTDVEWIKITTQYDIFESGTKIIFNAYPLPPNWTIDTTNNDRTILTTKTSGSVDVSGGSWTISGIQSAGAHDHGGDTSGPTNNKSYIGASDLYAYGNKTNHTHSISSDGSHQHTFDGNWRPAYIASIIAVYT